MSFRISDFSEALETQGKGGEGVETVWLMDNYKQYGNRQAGALRQTERQAQTDRQADKQAQRQTQTQAYSQPASQQTDMTDYLIW